MRTNHDMLGMSIPVKQALNPKIWRENYAWGIQGLGPEAALGPEMQEYRSFINAIPDHVVQYHLRTQLSELEVELGMPMAIRICKAPKLDAGERLGITYDELVPRLQYSPIRAMNYNHIKLPSGVISVERIRAYFWGQKLWEFSADEGNESSIILQSPAAGDVRLLPIDWTAGTFYDDAGGSIFRSLIIANGQSTILDFWAVDYTMGPVSDQGGGIGHIELVIAHWIGLKTSQFLLSLAGQGQSQGVSSESISFDGVSVSTGLQASAIYGINSALEEKCKKLLPAIKKLKQYKNPLQIHGW